MLFGLFIANASLLALIFRGLASSRFEAGVAARVLFGSVAVFLILTLTFWFECSPWAFVCVVAATAAAATVNSEQVFEPYGRSLGAWRFPIYVMSVWTTAFIVLIVSPITTFLTSPGEVGLHIEYLLSVNAPLGMLVGYVASAMYVLALSSRMKTILCLLGFGSLILATLYTYALPFGYPKMSGLVFEHVPLSDTAIVARVLADLAILIAVVALVRWAAIKFNARSLFVSILLLDFSLAAATVVNLMQDHNGGTGDRSDAIGLNEQPIRFSTVSPNVLIIFLDRFMGSYIEAILEKNPDIAERLSGFTWYPRTLSSGENSIAGVHGMYGGYDYLPVEMNKRGLPLRDVSTEAYSILPWNFSNSGYKVNFVNPGGLGFTMSGDCSFLVMDNVTCTHIPKSVVTQKASEMNFPMGEVSRAAYADLLVLLGSMRALPYLLKQVLLTEGPWRPFLDHSAGTTFRVWAELKSFPQLTVAAEDVSILNIITNILPHEPYFIGEDCLPKQVRPAISEEDARRRGHLSVFSLLHEVTAGCTLMLVADYLDDLKEKAVYDNTKIVIVSDHGIVGPVEDRSSRAVAGGTTDGLFVRTRSVLLVKEIGARGVMQVSEEFLPNAEVPRIVCEEIGGCVNPFLDNREIEALGRDDPFFVSLVPWQFNLQNPDSFVINAQLVLRGRDPFDVDGWERLQ